MAGKLMASGSHSTAFLRFGRRVDRERVLEVLEQTRNKRGLLADFL